MLHACCSKFDKLLTQLVSILQAMEEIWGYGEHIQCMHPAANCIAGRNLVSSVLCLL